MLARPPITEENTFPAHVYSVHTHTHTHTHAHAHTHSITACVAIYAY